MCDGAGFAKEMLDFGRLQQASAGNLHRNGPIQRSFDQAAFLIAFILLLKLLETGATGGARHAGQGAGGGAAAPCASTSRGLRPSA